VSDTVGVARAIPADTDEVIRVTTRRTPEQEREFLDALGRYRGQWVAVDDDDQIVASAPSLAELRKLIGLQSEAMVLEVEDVRPGRAVILGVA
jgi:Family of unknown function (DUF5678)